MSSCEKHAAFSDSEYCNKSFDTFAETIVDDKKKLEKNHERKIGGGHENWEDGNDEDKKVTGCASDLLRSNRQETAEDEKSSGPKPRKNNVETGYLTKNPKIVIVPDEKDNGEKSSQEVGESSAHPKISSMEEEAIRERMRATLLKQCLTYLAADGSSRYTRDTFRRVFTEKTLRSEASI
ncbi:hypothetical protein RUM43_005189 [Polyplax serrata]|uniref:Uncharacterized protein n=1 Tax=Polyplax serrata TaxID=468196 RepID=A0AAN8SCP6_POLSC